MAFQVYTIYIILVPPIFFQQVTPKTTSLPMAFPHLHDLYDPKHLSFYRRQSDLAMLSVSVDDSEILGDHQLIIWRIDPMIYRVFIYLSQVVVWDFWTINSINHVFWLPCRWFCSLCGLKKPLKEKWIEEGDSTNMTFLGMVKTKPFQGLVGDLQLFGNKKYKKVTAWIHHGTACFMITSCPRLAQCHPSLAPDRKNNLFTDTWMADFLWVLRYT